MVLQSPFLLSPLLPPPNKAGYTATEVACGRAGAIFKVTRPFGQEQWGPKIKIIKKVKCDRPTNRPTDRRTDKAGCRVACTRRKIEIFTTLNRVHTCTFKWILVDCKTLDNWFEFPLTQWWPLFVMKAICRALTGTLEWWRSRSPDACSIFEAEKAWA